MAVIPRAPVLTFPLLAAPLLAVLLSSSFAQDGPGAAPTLQTTPPPPFKPDPSDAAGSASDTWIFSGVLQGSKETFSGTLVTSKSDMQFELRLAGGATCEGGDLKPEPGLVRLSAITCSDDRTMRALFVPQGGQELKVFGHVGEERFATSAHLLGTEAVPDKPPTAAPKAPKPRPDGLERKAPLPAPPSKQTNPG